MELASDKTALKSAFEAYLEKLRAEQSQDTQPPGAFGFGDDGGFATACRGGQALPAGSFFSAKA